MPAAEADSVTFVHVISYHFMETSLVSASVEIGEGSIIFHGLTIFFLAQA